MKRAANVVSARPSMTMGEVGGLLEREHGHRSCPVISDDGVLVGVVSITEVDVAAIKGQLDRPVSGYMKLRSAVTLTTPVSECERILVENGEGCIPVVANYEDDKKAWKLAGLVTRATILNTHEYYRSKRMSGGRGFKGPPPKTKFNEVFFAEDVLSMDSIDDVEAALSAQDRESLEALLPREGDKGTTSEEAS
jgi:tRNA nucleotidyltransferase (CCA-adding enzyme)